MDRMKKLKAMIKLKKQIRQKNKTKKEKIKN